MVFTLQVLHASDQEAGIPALQDAIGLSAVMNALGDDYENSLRLTSGDVLIAGPFFGASADLYDSASSGRPAGQAGLADILIQNRLGWDAAAVGNHEFDAGDSSFFNLLAPKADWGNGAAGGQGIGAGGYPGALFPYLATNLNYGGASLPTGLTVVAPGGAPLPNSLTTSVVADVNGTPVGILAAVTPYLPAIANVGRVTLTTGSGITGATPINQQVEALVANLLPEIQLLQGADINKIILMTHLQEAEIEQALAQRLADLGAGVDILIGGGSHRVMSDSPTAPPLRLDETQQNSSQLLQPYPQIYGTGANQVYYVNTGSNYRYLSQLVVTFDDNGVITDVGEASGPYATDIAGVDRLYGADVTNFDQVKALADPELVTIVDGVGAFVNALDGTIYGQTDVFLNGIRGDVRTQETNLGNLTADANDFYAEQYLAAYADQLVAGFDRIDVSIKNGGGIRDIIGQSFVPGGGGDLVQLPPGANPNVGKESGDVSRLDISNSLRFDNSLVVGTVTATGLYAIAEHMVAAVERVGGQFGQIGGFRFSFDPTAAPRTTTNPGERIQTLALVDDNGQVRDLVVQDGALVGDPNRRFSVVTLEFLATGGDSYPQVFENLVSLADLAEPASLGLASLEAGGEQDALAEYLAANFNRSRGQAAFGEMDTPRNLDRRIQNLSFRSDTVLGDGDSTANPLFLDLRSIEGPVAIDFTVNRSALFDNFVGFYPIVDSNGGIDTDGDGVADVTPGQAGYREAALNALLQSVGLTTADGQESLFQPMAAGGVLYAPLIIADGTISDRSSFSLSEVYFAFTTANADGVEHIRLQGDRLLFEDLPGGGDNDFNDMVVNLRVNSLVNGVASGDVTQNSAVLWARSLATGPVTFEYSTDPGFTSLAGTTTATVADLNLPVKVNLNALQPGTEYFYRVIDAAGDRRAGRFVTAAPNGTRAGLSFGVSGDWRGELAPYRAIANVAGQQLDFFVALGDTIYADVPSPAVTNPDGSPKPQATSLADFRAKHQEVYSDRFGKNLWADVRTSTALYATIDDHEVTNDFAGGQTIGTDARFAAAFPADSPASLINDSTLFENGLRVFQEYNPLRDEFYGNTGDSRTANERKLYRANRFGNDAATFLLDTRSFRDQPLVAADITNPLDVGRFLLQSATLNRPFLGQVQLNDLKQDLLSAQASGVTWKFIIVPEPIQELGIYNADAFEGYARERTELLRFIETNGIKNVVFVAADIHGTFVNNLTYQLVPGGDRIATSAFEVTTGSVAYSPPFGPTVIDVASSLGLLSPQQRAVYDVLPIASDSDNLVNDKDDFLKSAFRSLAIDPAGYDPIGLNTNLPQADGLINATLLQGDYLAAHTYGWTQFDIDASSQKLTVTTYGITPYSATDLASNPEAVLGLTPAVVSQFEVTPNLAGLP